MDEFRGPTIAGLLARMPTALLPVATGRQPLPEDDRRALAAQMRERDAVALAEGRRVAAAARARAWDARAGSYRHAALDRLEPQQDPRGHVSEWLGGDARNLVLHGPSRHGKTWAAMAVGNTAVARGDWAIFWPVPDLNAALRPTDPGHDPQALEEATRCDLLVLDDLGKQADTPWTLEQLWRLLDARARHDRRTVVTFNLETEGKPYGALRDRHGEPIARRVGENARVVAIAGRPLDGPVRR